MSKLSFSDAFSAGLGLAVGLTTAQYMTQAIKTPQQKTITQVIICSRCSSRNPAENKFCGQCGQPLYPPPPAHCPSCGASMPSTDNFCGKCGSPLRKTERIKKRRRHKKPLA